MINRLKGFRVGLAKLPNRAVHSRMYVRVPFVFEVLLKRKLIKCRVRQSWCVCVSVCVHMHGAGVSFWLPNK